MQLGLQLSLELGAKGCYVIVGVTLAMRTARQYGRIYTAVVGRRGWRLVRYIANKKPAYSRVFTMAGGTRIRT